MTPSGAVDLFLCKNRNFKKKEGSSIEYATTKEPKEAAPKRATRIENKIFREEQIYECIRNCNVQDH